MERLTKSEEKIMHILWQLEKAFVKEVMNELPEPRPAYNTVSSIIRILEDKGFVSHRAFGKTHQYFPIVSKTAYKKFTFKQMFTYYFDGSYENIVSYLVNEENLSVQEIQEMLQMIEEDKNPDA